MNARPVSIVMIEDDEGHARLIERNIRRAGVNNEIVSFRNGTDGLSYLMGDDGSGEDSAQRSMLILLDLNLPGIDGCQVLSQIKNDPLLRTIPVVVQTTSHRDEDVLQTYQAGANTYIQKPAEYPRYRDLVLTLRQYWHETALRPPRQRPKE